MSTWKVSLRSLAAVQPLSLRVIHPRIGPHLNQPFENVRIWTVFSGNRVEISNTPFCALKFVKTAYCIALLSFWFSFRQTRMIGLTVIGNHSPEVGQILTEICGPSCTLFLFMPWFRAASHQASCSVLYWSTNRPPPQTPHSHCSSPNSAGVRLPTLYTSSHHNKMHAFLYVTKKA